MTQRTYDRRKAAGICPFCCATPPPGQVLCPTCIDHINTVAELRLTPEERETKRERALTEARAFARTLTQEPLKILAQASHARGAPSVPPQEAMGQLACCQAWQAITALPFQAPCCGRVWFAEAEVPDGHAE